MMNIGRNDLCLCGSNKKFKKCYGAVNSTCSIFLKEQCQKFINEHNEREKFVFRFFNEVLEDTNVILLKNKEGDDKLPLRVQMIIAFSLIDVLGSYWYEYLGKTGKTSERAQKWYEQFCLNDKNPNLLTPQDWSRISSDRLYQFRNSLVHFFGLSEKSDGIYFALAPNNLPDDKHKDWQKQFSKKGDESFIIKPANFYDLIREGAVLMLNEWSEVIKNAQTSPEHEKSHIEGIERIFNKINKEGAVKVMQEK